ncbi:MAG TPA: hypothetical protein VGN57_17120 [Pirellulaceae bacterium]|nr:hypothetical protein [Pirellulaceae bacterium]
MLNYLDKRTLLLSNGGRHLGWEVQSHGEIACSLHYHSMTPNQWDAYVIHAAGGAEDFVTEEFWSRNDLVFHSRACPGAEPLRNVLLEFDAKSRIVCLHPTCRIDAPRMAMIEAFSFAFDVFQAVRRRPPRS